MYSCACHFPSSTYLMWSGWTWRSCSCGWRSRLGGLFLCPWSQIDSPTNNRPLINFLLSSDAEILLTSTDWACKSAPNVQKRACNVQRIPTELPFCKPPLVVGVEAPVVHGHTCCHIFLGIKSVHVLQVITRRREKERSVGKKHESAEVASKPSCPCLFHLPSCSCCSHQEAQHRLHPCRWPRWSGCIEKLSTYIWKLYFKKKKKSTWTK